MYVTILQRIYYEKYVQMNLNMKRLKDISGKFRAFVLLATLIIVVYIIYGYAFHDKLYINTSLLFTELWEHSSANRMHLILFKVPSFFILFLSVYWLQHLLKCYQHGEFFTQRAMRCYVWLVWLKFIGLVMTLVETFIIGLYYDDIIGGAIINLNIHFGEITTTLLMLVIVYLLKAAKDIEAENKEFI